MAGPGIYAELPILDVPFVAANGGSFPSMEQSLWITAGLYQGMHLGLRQLADRYGQRWRPQLLGDLLISAADVLTMAIPGLLAWQHEEWHRAVLSSHGIGSFDDVYRLQLFAEVINVSHVRDDDRGQDGRMGGRRRVPGSQPLRAHRADRPAAVTQPARSTRVSGATAEPTAMEPIARGSASAR